MIIHRCSFFRIKMSNEFWCYRKYDELISNTSKHNNLNFKTKNQNNNRIDYCFNHSFHEIFDRFEWIFENFWRFESSQRIFDCNKNCKFESMLRTIFDARDEIFERFWKFDVTTEITKDDWRRAKNEKRKTKKRGQTEGWRRYRVGETLQKLLECTSLT